MKNGFIIPVILVVFGGLAAVFFAFGNSNSVVNGDSVYDDNVATTTPQIQAQNFKEETKPVISHVKTPDIMRAVYSTMWSASSKQKRAYLEDLLDKTDLNSIVIDVKGSGGEMIFDNFSDISSFINELHQKGVYVIARIVVFQDSGLAKTNPEFSLKKQDGSVWRDRKGFAWSDPASLGAWDHVVGVAKKSIDAGFDEINYDYIRFPTDGNLQSIVYPAWDGVEDKSDVIKRFVAYSKEKLKAYSLETKLSLDIFGYTFLNVSGLGIGQKLTDVLDNFDYIYPMVYPSHYSAGNFGFTNPADHPYEVVSQTLQKGLDSLGERKEEAKGKIRPWIQVFDLGAKYTPAMIEAQIKATYDVLGETNTGWLMWSPSNNYDEAFSIKL
ncbi:hypothetical protein HY249_03075 [Candidatus Azambacteria bacterium]|nr:hypothetical protein [Candidatus Azambacteria bacterium]